MIQVQYAANTITFTITSFRVLIYWVGETHHASHHIAETWYPYHPGMRVGERYRAPPPQRGPTLRPYFRTALSGPLTYATEGEIPPFSRLGCVSRTTRGPTPHGQSNFGRFCWRRSVA